MNLPEHPHTVLGESIRAFAAEVQKVTRRLAELERSGPDAGAAAAAAERLEDAQRRLEAEEQQLRDLLEAERIRYRDLFEWAPDAYLVSDPQGRIREANRAAERLLGQEREDLVGSLMVALLAPDDRAMFRTMLGRLPSLEVVSDWELTVRCVGKDTFPAAVTVSTVKDRHGAVVGLRWLIRDITERKSAEQQVVSANIALERRVRTRTEELEEALARLEALLDQMPAGVVIAEGSTRRIVTENEAAKRLRESVEAADGADETWPYSLRIAAKGGQRPIAKALDSGETTSGELMEFRRADGMRGILEVSAAPIRDRHGNVVSAVGTFRDVTVRERRARAEREFVTNAAHELRTPLAAIVSAVEVLQAGAKDHPPDRDRFLNHIEQQCNRLQLLVRSLLVLARAQTGQEAATTEEIAVGALLEGVASLVPRKRLRVELECDPQTTIRANRELAEQALLNLISNAVKYAPDSEIVLSSRREDGFVALEVVDSGPGMAPEERERAVERFYRGRDDGEGFGLGLSIASEAADALRGRLEIESADGAGTRTRLLVPAGR